MSLRKILLYLSLVVILLAFTGFALLAFLGDPSSTIKPLDLTLLIFGLGMAAYVAYQYMSDIAIQYTVAFHDLSREDAEEFIYWQRLYYDPESEDQQTSWPTTPMRMPKPLRVQSGQVDLDGPTLIHQVGGPGKLSVDHDSAVVTTKMGRLQRVLGPGFHDLQPFERAWHAIDLRPQRRTITVGFMTRDGIPATCQASIVCRVDGPGRGVDPVYKYNEDAVFKLLTSAYVKSLEGADRVSDWVVGMANGALDGAVRDVLEQYRLDEFLNPQHWLAAADGPSRIVSAPKLHTKLEAEVEARVRATGRQRGVIVDRVELGVVRPEEKAISRQWLEFWQAKLQQRIDLYGVGAEADRTELSEQALVEAQVGFINRILEQVHDFDDETQPMIPPELFITSVVDVLTGMVDHGPELQRMSFHQIEHLRKIVEGVHNKAEALALPEGAGTPQLSVNDDVS